MNGSTLGGILDVVGLHIFLLPSSGTWNEYVISTKHIRLVFQQLEVKCLKKGAPCSNRCKYVLWASRGPGVGEGDRGVTGIRLVGWTRLHLQGLIGLGNRYGFDPNSSGKSSEGLWPEEKWISANVPAIPQAASEAGLKGTRE